MATRPKAPLAHASARDSRSVSPIKAGAAGCEKSVDSLCCVCLDAEKDVVFTPCGHLCICRSCVSKLPVAQRSKCPICKGNGSVGTLEAHSEVGVYLASFAFLISNI